MVMLPAAPPTVSRAARRPEAVSARCQPNPSPSSYLPPFWPSGCSRPWTAPRSCRREGAAPASARIVPDPARPPRRHPRRRGHAATPHGRGPRGACRWRRSWPFWTLSRCQRVDLAAGGDTDAGRRGHGEQPVQLNRDAGGAERNGPDARAGAGPGQFDQDAGGAHGCASPYTAADAGESHLVSLSCQLHANARIGRGRRPALVSCHCEGNVGTRQPRSWCDGMVMASRHPQ